MGPRPCCHQLLRNRPGVRLRALSSIQAPSAVTPCPLGQSWPTQHAGKAGTIAPPFPRDPDAHLRTLHSSVYRQATVASGAWRNAIAVAQRQPFPSHTLSRRATKGTPSLGSASVHTAPADGRGGCNACPLADGRFLLPIPLLRGRSCDAGHGCVCTLTACSPGLRSKDSKTSWT